MAGKSFSCTAPRPDMAQASASPDSQRLEASLYCTEDVNGEVDSSPFSSLCENGASSTTNAATDTATSFQDKSVFHAAARHLSVPETMKVDAFVSAITGGGVKKSARIQNRRNTSKAKSVVTRNERSHKQGAKVPDSTPAIDTSSSSALEECPEVSAAAALANLMEVPVSDDFQSVQQGRAPVRVSSPEHDISSLECSSNSIASNNEQIVVTSSDAEAMFAQLKERTSNARAMAASEGKKKRRSAAVVSSPSSPECSKKKLKRAGKSTSSAATSTTRKVAAASESRTEGKTTAEKAKASKKLLPLSTRRSSTYLPCNAGKDRRWTTAEDNRLRRAIVFDGVEDWKKICSEYFEDERTPEQCQKRWQNVLSVGLVKGKWSPHEDEAIVDALLNGVTSWKQLAKSVPGRMSKQCRERWQNHLDPSLQNQSWTLEEDDVLKEAQAHWGNRWKVIAMLYPGRSETSVKNRWNSARFKPYKTEKITTNYLKFNLPIEKRVKSDKHESKFVTSSRKTANEIERKGVDFMMSDGHSDHIELTEEAREALLESKTELRLSIKTPKSPRQPKKVVKNVDNVVPLAPAASLQDYHQSKPIRQISRPPPTSPNVKSKKGKSKVTANATKQTKKPVKAHSPSPPPPPEVFEPNPIIYPGAPGTTTTTRTITTASGQQQQIVIIQQACCACCCLQKQQHKTVPPPVISNMAQSGANFPSNSSREQRSTNDETISSGSGASTIADSNAPTRVPMYTTSSSATSFDNGLPAEGTTQDSNSNMDVLMKAIKMC